MKHTYHFDGSTYDPIKEGARLTTEFERVLAVMLDGGWHTITEVTKKVSYPPYASASENGAAARIRDCRKEKFGGYIIERRRVKDAGLYEYRLVKSETKQQEIFA